MSNNWSRSTLGAAIKDTLVGAAFFLVFFGGMALASRWWGDAGLIGFLIGFWSVAVGLYALAAIRIIRRRNRREVISSSRNDPGGCSVEEGVRFHREAE